MHLKQETVGFCGNNVKRWGSRRKAVHNDVTDIRLSLVLFSFIRAIIIDYSHEKGAAETRLVIDTFCKVPDDAWSPKGEHLCELPCAPCHVSTSRKGHRDI